MCSGSFPVRPTLTREELERETSERTRVALAEVLARKRRAVTTTSKHEQVRPFPYELQRSLREEVHELATSDASAHSQRDLRSLDPFRPPRRQRRRKNSAGNNKGSQDLFDSVPIHDNSENAGAGGKAAAASDTGAEPEYQQVSLVRTTNCSMVPVSAAPALLDSSQLQTSVKHLRVPPVKNGRFGPSARRMWTGSTVDATGGIPAYGYGSTFAAPAFTEFATALARATGDLSKQRNALRSSDGCTREHLQPTEGKHGMGSQKRSQPALESQGSLKSTRSLEMESIPSNETCQNGCNAVDASASPTQTTSTFTNHRRRRTRWDR